jgi:hypothetical protein
MRAVVLLALMLAGCATAPEKVAATFVDPAQYRSYDCARLAQEIDRVGLDVDRIAGAQRNRRTQDQVAVGVGLFLFWPALPMTAWRDHATELGWLKGEYEALRVIAEEKRCGQSVEPGPNKAGELI